MPPHCTVCNHPDLARIDSALLGTESMRIIASQFGLNKSAVQRHKKEHLPALMMKAKEAESIAKADSLLEQVQKAQSVVLRQFEAAEVKKDWKLFFQADKSLRGYFDLVGKLTGQLANGTNVNVNVSNMPSPASGGTAEPELSAFQLGDLLASLDPALLQEALSIAQQIHADNQAADRVVENAIKPAQALGAPANLPAETHAANSSKPAPAGAGPVQSRFQPGRMPWER